MNISEECNLIDEALIAEGFFHRDKKNENSPIARKFRSVKENLNNISDLLTKGKFVDASKALTPFSIEVKDLKFLVDELVKGQEKVKAAQQAELKKAQVAKSNQKSNEYSDEDYEDFRDNSQWSIKTESVFNY